MNIMDRSIDKNASIVIVGAGPAGLSTAWFLSKNGFHNVTVLEKLGRVGGLCKSLTIDGRSFDIGANYVTWAYKETLAIAKEVGAETYPEKPYTSLKVNADLSNKPEFRSFKEAILYNYYTKRKVSILSFLVAACRYLYIRWKLSDIIDAPGYLDNIHNHKDICVSFKDWLTNNNLMPLSAMFQFPITIMGYGQLDDIATPYALRYMSLRTVTPMVFGSWGLNLFIGSWPRRFTFGFQRLWQQVAWRTNVRLNVNITKIERSNNKIKIDMEFPAQELNDLKITSATQTYDYLILACPLTPDVFEKLNLERNEYEINISQKIKINPYCMTTFWINKMNMPQPIAPVIPIPNSGIPWAIARQFQHNNNMFTQFYTRPSAGQSDDEVITKVRKVVELLGGEINDSQARWHTFDKFTYFQHFNVTDISDGVYSTLAQMQGKNGTYYVGGATDFELIEPIVNHSKYIVDKYFIANLSNDY